MRSIIRTLFFLLISFKCIAQDTVRRLMTIDELFTLVEGHNRQLLISRQNIEISQQRTEIARSERLPEIGADADAGYLSTIAILNPDLSWHANVPTPHFTNNYGIGASETIYQGGYIQNNIKRSKLAEELSRLDYDKDKQNVKLLFLGQYLQLYQLQNSREIFLKNIQLAKKRLKDLTLLRSEGLVIQNDLIRNELLIKDFELDLDETNNNIAILNRDLCIYLELPTTTQIAPDTSLLKLATLEKPLAEYLRTAYALQPEMKATIVKEKIADKNIRLEKAARLPVVSLYAGDALQRPFLNTLEPLDIYYNAYQAGLKVKFNISSIYHAKEHIQLAKLQYDQELSRTSFQRQQTESAVHTAFTKYTEAKQRFQTLDKSLQLANDNYRVVEKKYANQLAQITDMLDASTAKLSAELRLSNARINIIAEWYKLQKASGDF